MARIRTIEPEIWIAPTGPAAFWIYCITETGFETTGPCKVGRATHVNKRLSALQGGNWRQLNLIWQLRVGNRWQAADIEQHLLIMHRPNPYSGAENTLWSEWIAVAPAVALRTALHMSEIVADAKIVRLK